MIQTDTKTQRQAEYTQQHTLTPADVQRMLAERRERAEAYMKALRKREALLVESR